MACIRIERLVEAPADRVWDAVRDVSALHTRLVPGFVVDTRMDGDARAVTFGNGMTAREVIVDLDDARRRFAYSIKGESLSHHHATNAIFDEGDGRCRFVWIADFLPDAALEVMRPMMKRGSNVLKATLEKAARET